MIRPIPGRGFGRTTDMLLESIRHQWSTGRPVVVLGHNQVHARDLCRRWAGLSEAKDLQISADQIHSVTRDPETPLRLLAIFSTVEHPPLAFGVPMQDIFIDHYAREREIGPCRRSNQRFRDLARDSQGPRV